VPGKQGRAFINITIMCKGTPRTRLVEVAIDSIVKTEFSLKDEEVLRKAKRIIAIEAYKVGTVSIAPSTAAVVNDTVFDKSFLTLGTEDGEEVIYKLPLADLNRAANNGQLFYVDIPPIAPSKCSIKVATTAALSAAEVFLLCFHYEM
jgi:hypothetical protein